MKLALALLHAAIALSFASACYVVARYGFAAVAEQVKLEQAFYHEDYRNNRHPVRNVSVQNR